LAQGREDFKEYHPCHHGEGQTCNRERMRSWLSLFWGNPALAMLPMQTHLGIKIIRSIEGFNKLAELIAETGRVRLLPNPDLGPRDHQTTDHETSPLVLWSCGPVVSWSLWSDQGS